MTPLDRRLRAVYDFVRPGSVIADVGADHGYLVCALVESGKCPRGFACDIGEGPLAASARHIRENGLEHLVQTVLSDGLRELRGGEVDDIVIAGMGGELIGEILTAVPWTRDGDKRFILQPMTRAEHLRRLLYAEGFALTGEEAVETGRFVYTVMAAAYTGDKWEVDPLFALTGLLWEKSDRASLRYLTMVRRRLQRQAIGLERSGRAVDEQLRQLVERFIERTGDDPCIP